MSSNIDDGLELDSNHTSGQFTIAHRRMATHATSTAPKDYSSITVRHSSLTVPLLPTTLVRIKGVHETIVVGSGKPHLPEQKQTMTDKGIRITVTGNKKEGHARQPSSEKNAVSDEKTKLEEKVNDEKAGHAKKTQQVSGRGKNSSLENGKSDTKSQAKSKPVGSTSNQHIPTEAKEPVAARSQQAQLVEHHTPPGEITVEARSAIEKRRGRREIYLDPVNRRFIAYRNSERSSPNTPPQTLPPSPGSSDSMPAGAVYVDLKNQRFVRKKQPKVQNPTPDSMAQQPQFVQWAGQAMNPPHWGWSPPTPPVAEPAAFRPPIPPPGFPFFPPWYPPPPGLVPAALPHDQHSDVGHSKRSSKPEKRSEKRQSKGASTSVPVPPGQLIAPVLIDLQPDGGRSKKSSKAKTKTPKEDHDATPPPPISVVVAAAKDQYLGVSRTKASSRKTSKKPEKSAAAEEVDRAPLVEVDIIAGKEADIIPNPASTTSKRSKKTALALIVGPKLDTPEVAVIIPSVSSRNNNAPVSKESKGGSQITKSSATKRVSQQVDNVEVHVTVPRNSQTSKTIKVTAIVDEHHDARLSSTESKPWTSPRAASSHPRASSVMVDPVKVAILPAASAISRASKAPSPAPSKVPSQPTHISAVEASPKSHRSSRSATIAIPSSQTSTAKYSQTPSKPSHASHFKAAPSNLSAANSASSPKAFFEVPQKSSAWHSHPNTPERWICRPEPPNEHWDPGLPSLHPRDSASQITASSSSVSGATRKSGKSGRELVVVEKDERSVGTATTKTRRSSNYKAPTVVSVASSGKSGEVRQRGWEEGGGMRVRIRTRTRTRTMGWEQREDVEEGW